MVNINKLKGKIMENGYTVETLSKKMGINTSTFYRKMADKGRTFSIEEASALVKILQIKNEEAMAIFFAQDVA